MKVQSARSPQPHTAASPTPAKPAAAAATSAGQAGDSLSTSPVARDAKNFEPFLLDQGHSFACGTTSLAMLMNFWKNNPSAHSRESLDAAIRPMDIGSSPMNLSKYAKEQGFQVVARNNSSIEDLTKLLDQGVPVQILYDRDDNDANFVGQHFVLPIGYSRDAQGQVSAIRVADPYHKTYDVPIDLFKSRWDHLKMKNVGYGYNNYMNILLPKENVPITGPDGRVRQSKDIVLPAAQKPGAMAHVVDALADLGIVVGKAKRGIQGFFERVKGWLS